MTTNPLTPETRDEACRVCEVVNKQLDRITNPRYNSRIV